MTCAIYIRVSTEKQKEKFSLPSQRKILIEYAKKERWKYILYDEGAGSGSSLDERPEMQQLLKDAQAQKFNVCLVIDEDRLSRDLGDYITITNIFKENGIWFGSPNNLNKIETANTKLMRNIKGSISQFYLDQLKENSKRGSLEAAKQGVYIGNHFRLGYKYDKTTKTISAVPEEAEVVRLIFKLCNEDNLGTNAIADYLNSKGTPTVLEFAQKKGISGSGLKIGRWTGGVVYRILTNPIYYGVYHYNRAIHKKRRKVGKRPESEWVKMSVEPIVSLEDFHKAQENLKSRAKWTDRNVKNEYLLSGLLNCAECESKLQGVTFKACEYRGKNGRLTYKRWKTNAYYKCYGRAKKDCKLPYKKAKELDESVWEAMKLLVKYPQKVLDNAIRRQKAELKQTKQTLPSKLKELEKELNNLNKAQDRLLDAFSMGVLDQSDLNKQMPKIKLRKSRCQAEMDNLKLQMAGSEVREEKLSNLSGIKGGIDRFDFTEKREFLRNVVDRIILYKSGIIDIITVLDTPLGEPLKYEYSKAGPGSKTYAARSMRKDSKIRRFTLRISQGVVGSNRP